MALTSKAFNGRPAFFRDLLQDTEAVEAGHVDIEQDQVGRELFDRVHRIDAVAGLADDDHIASGGECGPHTLANERFVVDEQDVHRNPPEVSSSVPAGVSLSGGGKSSCRSAGSARVSCNWPLW